MVNYRYPIVVGKLYERQSKFLKLKKQIKMVEIMLEENDMEMIEEETQEEMIEFKNMEEKEKKDRAEFLNSEIEDWVPDEKISGARVGFKFKSSLSGVSLTGNLGGLIWREMAGLASIWK